MSRAFPKGLPALRGSFMPPVFVGSLNIDLLFGGIYRRRTILDMTRRTGMERFHATSAHAAPHGLLNGVERLVNGNVQRRVSSSNHDAGEPTQDNLYSAFLIHSASWTVGVPRAHSYPLDRPGELSQLHSQPSPDVRVVIVIECDTRHAHVCRNRRGAAPDTLERPRHRGWQNSPPTRFHELTDLTRHRSHRFTLTTC
jgi:hypothetical protein